MVGNKGDGNGDRVKPTNEKGEGVSAAYTGELMWSRSASHV